MPRAFCGHREGPSGGGRELGSQGQPQAAGGQPGSPGGQADQGPQAKPAKGRARAPRGAPFEHSPTLILTHPDPTMLHHEVPIQDVEVGQVAPACQLGALVIPCPLDVPL